MHQSIKAVKHWKQKRERTNRSVWDKNVVATNPLHLARQLKFQGKVCLSPAGQHVYPHGYIWLWPKKLPNYCSSQSHKIGGGIKLWDYFSTHSTHVFVCACIGTMTDHEGGCVITFSTRHYDLENKAPDWCWRRCCLHFSSTTDQKFSPVNSALCPASVFLDCKVRYRDEYFSSNSTAKGQE